MQAKPKEEKDLPFTEEERTHAKSALILTVAAVIIIILSLLLTLDKADPRGVYICTYEITADGERESSGKNIEYHLKKNGIATYVSDVDAGGLQKIQLNGSWKKDGSKIILTFAGEETVFYRSGSKLIEKLADGSRVVYIKD